MSVYNDSDNLRTAVDSVRRQTLKSIEIIIVDDRSTDGSFEIAKKLARADNRIRAFQMTENSGGAGGPRNLGISKAKGKWVTFVDSDDRIDRHACKNMLRAGETYNVELVCGQTKRFDVATERWSGWHSRLYSEPKTMRSISEWVELVIDSNSTAKLFNKDFLERENLLFPSNIHYEDLVFSANVYNKANGIHVIPEVVYVWKVYPKETRKSITNQRDDLNNLSSRLTAIDKIKSDVYPTSDINVQRRFDLKTLRHDARLYLNDFRWCNDVHAYQVLDKLIPYIRNLDHSVFAELTYGERCLYAAALSRSPRLVRLALRMAAGEVAIAGMLKHTSDSVMWVGDSKHPIGRDQLTASLVDLTETRVVESPWIGTSIHHEIEEVTKSKSEYAFEISGASSIQHLNFFDYDKCNAKIIVKPRTRNLRSNEFTCNIIQWTKSTFEWSAFVSIPSELTKSNNMTYDLLMTIESNGQSNTAPIWIDLDTALTKKTIKKRGLLSTYAAAEYKVTSDTTGRLIIRQTPIGRHKLEKVAKLNSFGRRVSRWKNGRVDHNRLIWKTLYAAMRLAPIRRNTSLFESHMGRSLTDSPGAVANRVRELHPKIKCIWSVADPKMSTHQGESTVLRGSLRYLWLLATSGTLVDNQTLPSYFRKRKSQVYLQTWHGIPLKTMGFDEPSIKKSTAKQQQLLRKRVSYWDYLNVPSSYFEETFVPAYEFTGTSIFGGTPRNDALVDGTLSRSSSRRALGISDNRKVILYAPTFRKRGNVSIELDINSWIDALGDESILLVRSHYLNKFNIPKHLSGFIVDCSDVDDVNILYSASDMMITDYSSTIFDYSLQNKPIILYAYDYEQYVSSDRGTYFDLADNAPGALCYDQDSLHTAVLERLETDLDREMRTEFRQRYLGAEDGTASLRTVEKVWGK